MENPILFYSGDSPWTLGGVLIVCAAGLAFTWVAAMPFVLRKLNIQGHRLDSQEAATLAMTGREPGYVKPQAIVHGPAAGMEWSFSFTIGDLRQAWHSRRYRYFFGLPFYSSLFPFAFCVASVGFFALRSDAFVVMCVVVGFCGLIILMIVFMMWAAVYTKLE